MVRVSRQTMGFGANIVFILIWFLITVGVLYRFCFVLERKEKTLLGIKRLLESKTS